MESADVNWLAVVVAALIPMVLGALWYSPRLFARPWLAATGRTPEEISGAGLGYAISAVGALLGATVLSYIVDWAEADRQRLPVDLVRADGRAARRVGLTLPG